MSVGTGYPVAVRFRSGMGLGTDPGLRWPQRKSHLGTDVPRWLCFVFLSETCINVLSPGKMPVRSGGGPMLGPYLLQLPCFEPGLLECW